MEAEEIMELRDLPVDTRNYTIIDNITGKPIDQDEYSLTIDPEVIGKLNKLKAINEEKVRQATLKGLYKDDTLVETFTPTDNSVFTPVYEGEYINSQDYNETVELVKEEEVKEEETKEETPTFSPTEVIQQETVLERVVARDPSSIPVEEPEPINIVNNENGDNIENGEAPVTTEGENTPPVDNSVFTPEKSGFEQASEQIVKIDAEKIGPAIKTKRHEKPDTRINLDKMEVREGKGVAWLAYILFFLPLLFKRRNRFVRIHANEGLELNMMEILGGLLLLPHFLLTNLTGIWQTVSLVAGLLGIVIIGMCALTILPMIICAMCGLQFQVPWLWKRRMIKVAQIRE